MSDADEFGLDDEALATHATVYAADAFAGKVALVSGGAGGIGRAVAWLLAPPRRACRRRRPRRGQASGAERGDDAARPLRLGRRGRHPRAGTGRARCSTACLTSAAGSICSSTAPAASFRRRRSTSRSKGWNAVINTNLNGTWRMMQAAARRWRDAKQPGSIVNIVVVTTHGLYGVAHTIAARAGVIGLSRAVAVEWAPLGIRVNCIAPGAIETGGWKVYSPEARAAYPRSNPMMRAAQPGKSPRPAPISAAPRRAM